MVFHVAFLFLFTATARYCSPESYSVGLTQCAANRTRSAIYIGTGDCDSPPPAPIRGLSCEVDCASGSYLGFDRGKKTSACLLCPANTFSIGGGVRFAGNEESWFKLASHFIAYCYVSELYSWIFKKDCNSWAPSDDGKTLVSGNTTRRAWAQSELVYYADIVKPGKLTVEYRKKTRMYNGGLNGVFEVFVNEESVLEDSDLGNESWNSVSVPLQVGMTEIAIIYEKFNAAGFEDLSASIRMVEVRGTAMNALVCSPCSSGYSLTGADECSACRDNEYYEVGSCRACPAGTYSRSGSKGADSCKLKPPCTEADYKQELTGCLSGTSTIHYEWNQPHICNETTGVLLPSAELGKPCEACSPGNYRKPVREGDLETKCAACPAGTAGNGTSPQCDTCQEGFYAPRVLNYSSWTSLPAQVSNDCRPYTGQTCSDANGWTLSSAGLTSGQYLNSNCYLTLAVYTNIVEANSYFQLSWSMRRNHTSGSQLLVEVDGNLEKILKTDDYKAVSNEIPLAQGGRVIRLVYHHAGTQEDWCTVHWLAIRGSDSGGSPKCEECRVGTYSPLGSALCSLCPAGQTSNGEKSACVKCPDNAYSDIAGNPFGCTPCTAHTVPNLDRTTCIGSQNITFGHSLYPLENLTGLRTGREGYVQGLCSKEKFALFCNGPFYGPIRTPKGEYYTSVLNPAHLSLEAFSHFDNQTLGYAYGVINREELPLTGLKVPDASCASDSSKLIVNLGSQVASVNVGGLGFNISYVSGAKCNEVTSYSSDLIFLCDKKEGDGFPELLEATECHYSFVWKSRLACPLCGPNDLSIVRGACSEGVRYVYYVEGRNCTLHSQDRESLYMIESCTVIGEVLGTTIALVVIAILTFLTLVSLIVFGCFCKVSSQYRRLLQSQGSSKT